jgi:hypothetical protein
MDVTVNSEVGDICETLPGMREILKRLERGDLCGVVSLIAAIFLLFPFLGLPLVPALSGKGDFELRAIYYARNHPHPGLLPEYQEKKQEVHCRKYEVTPSCRSRQHAYRLKHRSDAWYPFLENVCNIPVLYG